MEYPTDQWVFSDTLWPEEQSALVNAIAAALQRVDRAAREECADTAARIMLEFRPESRSGIVAQRIANTILETIKR